MNTLTRRILIVLVVGVFASTTEAATPAAREHLSGWDDYYVGRTIPGLIAPRWSGHQHLGQVTIIDLSRIRDDHSKIMHILARFNRGEFADDVLRLPAPLDVPYVALDINNDGSIDLLLDTPDQRATLIWSPTQDDWQRTDLPTEMGAIGGRLAVVRDDGAASLVIRSIARIGAWHFVGEKWQPDPSLTAGLEIDGIRILTSAGGRDRGVRFRDLDGDGQDELIVANREQQAILEWSSSDLQWQPSSMHWPADVRFTTDDGGDAGVRFADVNGDDRVDLLVSGDEGSAIFLFRSARDGFGPALLQTARDQPGDSLLPPFASEGRPTGAWFDGQTRSILGPHGEIETGSSLSWNRLLRFAAMFPNTVPGFARLEHNDGDDSVWYDYSGQQSSNHFIRQQKVGSKLVWQTASVPQQIDADRVTFLFAGGLGYKSESATDGFALTVNDKSRIEFDLTYETTTWTSDDEKATLTFEPTWQSDSDAAGFFRLTVDRSELTPGESLTLTVTSLGEGSQRWFSIHPIAHPLPVEETSP